MSARLVVYKQDVIVSLANAIMALGKTDRAMPERVRYHITAARANFEQWLADRPEKYWRELAEERRAEESEVQS